jgi:hypothetical protein
MLVLPFRASVNKTMLLDPEYSVGIRFAFTSHRDAYMLDLDNRYLSTPSSSSVNYQEVNFDHNNVVMASLRWVISTNTEFDSYVHSNYLHAYDPERTLSYFYFITNVKVLREDVLEYTLELDVITTYLPSIFFDRELFVERHHCNRFTPLAAKLGFNFKEALLGDELDSKFEAQVVNSSSLTYRKPDYFTGQTNLNSTINNMLWMYAWVMPTTEHNNTTKIRMKPVSAENSIDTGLQLYVAPIGLGEIINLHILPDPRTWTAKFLYDHLLRDAALNARVISVKISPYAPFNRYAGYVSSSPQFEFKPVSTGGGTNNKLEIDYTDTNPTTDYNFGVGSQYCITGTTASKWAITDPVQRFVALNWICSTHSNTAKDFLKIANFNVGIPDNFDKPTNLTPRSQTYEPKMYISPYYRFNYHHKYEVAKTLNSAYIGRGSIAFNIIDTVLAHEQKTTVEVVPEHIASNYYIKELETNRSATEINSYDVLTSLNQYADYVSNHKNHLISGIAQPVVQQLGMGLAMTGITGNPMPIISAGISAGATTFSHLAKLNDLKSSPDTIKNTGNNILHDINLERNQIGLRTYTTELTLYEKEQVFEYYYKYGYRVNKLKTWSVQTAYNERAIFTRTRFNYVKTNDEEIANNIKSSVPISRIIKQKIQDILNNGIRLITSGATASATNDNAKLINENIEILL